MHVNLLMHFVQDITVFCPHLKNKYRYLNVYPTLKIETDKKLAKENKEK